MFVWGFGGSLPSEGLAGPAVERGRDGLDLLGAPSAKVGALREVLAQETVGVLVGGVGEEDRDSGLDFEHRVGGELLAAIPNQQSAQLLGSVIIVAASAFFIVTAP